MMNRYFFMLSVVILFSACVPDVLKDTEPEPEPYKGYFEVNGIWNDVVKLRSEMEEETGAYLSAEAALDVNYSTSSCTLHFKGGKPATGKYPITHKYDFYSSAQRRLYVEVFDVPTGLRYFSADSTGIKADVTVDVNGNVNIKIPDIPIYPQPGRTGDTLSFKCELIKE